MKDFIRVLAVVTMVGLSTLIILTLFALPIIYWNTIEIYKKLKKS